MPGRPPTRSAPPSPLRLLPMATLTAAEKREFLSRLAGARDDAAEGSVGRIVGRIAAGLAVLALLALIACWWSGLFSTPREVLEIRSMVDTEIAQLEKVARNEAPLTFESPAMRQSWDRMRDMPRGVRDQARREMDRLFQAREQAELRSYFALPPQERLKELDRRIKAEDARRQARQRGSTAPGSRNQTAGSPSAGGSAAASRGPSGGGGGPAGGNPATTAGVSGSGRRRGSEDDRNLRSKQRIDATSPTERAQSAEYRRAMDARRAQLGTASASPR